MQYLLFCSILHCDRVRHQLRSEHIPLIFRQSCKFDTNLRIILDSKQTKLRIVRLVEKPGILIRSVQSMLISEM